MDNTILKARELGKAIQEDSRYINFMDAQEASEKDSELQKLMVSFEIARNGLNAEIQKDDKNTEKIKELDTEVKDLYANIFETPSMKAITDTRGELQSLLEFVDQIIKGSSNGQNPETIEFQENCGGSCGSCAGC